MDVAFPLELRYPQQGHNLPGQNSSTTQASTTPLHSASVTSGSSPVPIPPQTSSSPEKLQHMTQNEPNQTAANGIDHLSLNTSNSTSKPVNLSGPASSAVPQDVTQTIGSVSSVPPVKQPVNGNKIMPPSGIPRIRPSGIPRWSNLPRTMPTSPSLDFPNSNGSAAGVCSTPAPISERVTQSAGQPVSTPISPLSAPPHTQASLSEMGRPSLGHMDLANHEDNFSRQHLSRSRAGVRSATTRGDRATSEHPHRFADTESDTSSIFSSSGAPKVITSKINSMKNVHHKPGGGNVSIVNEKVQLGPIKSKCNSFANVKHKPGGGNVKIVDEKLDLSSTQSRIGSLQNAKHVPTGGNIQIVTQKLDFDKNAKSKIGSLKNANHRPGGGDVQIFNESLPWLKYNKPNLPPEERARINKQRSGHHSGMTSSMHSGSTGS